MKTLILTTLILIFSAQSFAKGLKDETEIKTSSTQFFNQLGKSDVEGAMNVVRGFFPMAPAAMKSFSQKMTSARAGFSKFGTFNGFSFLETRTRGDLMKVSFLEKYEKHVVVWDLIYFRNQTDWQLDSIYWEPNAKNFFNP